MKRNRVAIKLFLIMAVIVGGCVVGVAAQTPTPPPTPTPSVVEVDTGTFVIEPHITYGEAGVMIGLLFVAALMFLSLAMEVISWLRQ